VECHQAVGINFQVIAMGVPTVSDLINSSNIISVIVFNPNLRIVEYEQIEIAYWKMKNVKSSLLDF
jgi:hypothetical protein